MCVVSGGVRNVLPDGELRGSVKNGRWQPAQAKRTPHAGRMHVVP